MLIAKSSSSSQGSVASCWRKKKIVRVHADGNPILRSSSRERRRGIKLSCVVGKSQRVGKPGAETSRRRFANVVFSRLRFSSSAAPPHSPRPPAVFSYPGVFFYIDSFIAFSRRYLSLMLLRNTALQNWKLSQRCFSRFLERVCENILKKIKIM